MKTRSSEMFFKHFPWNFSSEKSILSSQGEAIASFSLMLATALKLLGLLKRSCPMLTKVSMRMTLYLAVLCYQVLGSYPEVNKFNMKQVQRRATRWIFEFKASPDVLKRRGCLLTRENRGF